MTLATSEDCTADRGQLKRIGDEGVDARVFDRHAHEVALTVEIDVQALADLFGFSDLAVGEILSARCRSQGRYLGLSKRALWIFWQSSSRIEGPPVAAGALKSDNCGSRGVIANE